MCRIFTAVVLALLASLEGGGVMLPGARMLFDQRGPQGWDPVAGASVLISKDAYIDLGVVPTPTMFFRYAGRTISGINGCLTANASVRFNWSYNARQFSWPWTPYVFSSVPAYPSYDGEFSVDAVEKEIVYYGSTFAITNSPTFSLPVTITIGGRHYGATVDNLGESEVKRITYGDGGAILHDWYPRLMDGVAGLYDVVGGGFLTNATSAGSTTYQEPT